ncbi:DNA adenine methylase [soil metagenome]
MQTLDARPIVKWAGGKRMLVPTLLSHLPSEIGTYVEPFAGGAALFFALANEASSKRADARTFRRAVLADRNEDLVACYRAVRDSVEELIVALGAYRYDQKLFYEVRGRDPSTMSDVERGARLIFLNRTCFNGLWRVNGSGKFNVPFGRFKNPRIRDESGLRDASRALANVDVQFADFGEVTKSLKQGDFAYFDPPYVPVSKTADFTSYAEGGFGPKDQARLVDTLRALREKGILAMLSNADTEAAHELYEDFAVHQVEARRAINADSAKRGTMTEILVLNWGRPGYHAIAGRVAGGEIEKPKKTAAAKKTSS